MSYQLFINGKVNDQIASNSGWMQFREEVQQLGPPTELGRLIDEGISESPAHLRTEIRDIACGLTKPSQEVARAILKLLPKRGTISIGQ